MSRKTLLALSAGMLLSAAIAAPTAALAQFGPPPGPPPMLAGPPPGLGAGGPPPGLGAGGPPLGGRRPGPVAGLPPRGSAGAPPREFAGGPPRLDGAGGLHGLERRGHANFRGVEGRAAAYGADGYARNSYTNYGYRRGYRHAQQRRLTPMAEPMPLPTMAATTSPRTGDTAPGEFWSVMKID